MGKFGKGLGKEFVLAVLNKEVPEVFRTKDVKEFSEKRGWNPSDMYVNVLLPNSSSSSHSDSYPQHFTSIGNGDYEPDVANTGN